MASILSRCVNNIVSLGFVYVETLWRNGYLIKWNITSRFPPRKYTSTFLCFFFNWSSTGSIYVNPRSAATCRGMPSTFLNDIDFSAKSHSKLKERHKISAYTSYFGTISSVGAMPSAGSVVTRSWSPLSFQMAWHVTVLCHQQEQYCLLSRNVLFKFL